MRPNLWFAVLIATFAVASSAQEPPGPPDETALPEQARRYAEAFGVRTDVALHRLRLQEAVGAQDHAWAREEAETFAGLWIEHSPRLRVVARFTDPATGGWAGHSLKGGPLEGLVEVREARFSLAQLEADQAAAAALVRKLGIPADAGIDVRENRVELYVLDPEPLETALAAAGLRLPDSVALVTVPVLSAPEADLYAGFGLTTCTSGFAVRNAAGTRGVLTAAHCQNSQARSGSNLPFQSERCGGSYDVQWHTAPAFTVKGWIRAQCRTRVTGSTLRASQSVGQHVCKVGMTTGMTCGTISDKNYLPNFSCSTSGTYVKVAGGSVNLSEGGDSGGPWFSGGNAYGVHICGLANDSCYMPIDYISALGVSVITSDPLTCLPPGQFCLSGTDCCCGVCFGLGGGAGYCLG